MDCLSRLDYLQSSYLKKMTLVEGCYRTPAFPGRGGHDEVIRAKHFVTPSPSSYTCSEVFSGESCAKEALPPDKSAIALARTAVLVTRKQVFLIRRSSIRAISILTLLANRRRFQHPNRRHRPSHDRCDLAHLDHQFIELIGE